MAERFPEIIDASSAFRKLCNAFGLVGRKFLITFNHQRSAEQTRTAYLDLVEQGKLNYPISLGKTVRNAGNGFSLYGYGKMPTASFQTALNQVTNHSFKI